MRYGSTTDLGIPEQGNTQLLRTKWKEYSVFEHAGGNKDIHELTHDNKRVRLNDG